MKEYNHLKIEPKWRKIWEKKGINKTKDNTKSKKFYILDMFPYPSGAGLHVGHPRGFVATDVYSRYKRMHGFNVLHPMGWDAFGLPAENYAIKNKTNPIDQTIKNVKIYKEQTSILGFNYDWSREINTTDPNYYKWTQWTFLQMFKKGLAFESFEPINWCPSCKTGLANEDLDGPNCERCGTQVEKKPMRQWVLKITKYADRLLEDLNTLDWPESVKESQRNWIGRSEGSELWFNIKNFDGKIRVFTTRPDTLFGVTYVVLAPENKLVDELKSQIKNWKEVEKYREEVKSKTEIERTTVDKNKTGLKLIGVEAKHPLTKEILPVFIADYVLNNYGTGAVMAVPAHDERDYAFAKKYNLPIKTVIKPHILQEIPSDIQGYAGNRDIVLTSEINCYVGNGVLINSGEFDGMDNEAAKKKITDAADGEQKVTYKLKDWVFSRQRYWGEPIPLIHCDKCGVVAVPEKDLPVRLPKVKFYEPTGTGESPLAAITKWVNVKCPKCGGKGKRETNTMPQWAGSSWYYLRYIDPKNKKALVDKKKEKYWSPVDLYVGGGEHNTRHLIYARFWHKFLFDIGVVNYKEPFMKLRGLGMILGSDGRKMSKRWGNVVNPDDVVKNVGADTLRVYEMFMGPFDQEIAWSTDNMVGSRRFLDKVWRLQNFIDKSSSPLNGVSNHSEDVSLENFEILLNKTIKKVTEDILNFSFNTAISAFMILVNQAEKTKLLKSDYEKILKLLAPFAPHMTDEIWANLGHKKSIHLEKWPEFDDQKIVTETILIIVQINGKVRATFEMPNGSKQEQVERIALTMEDVSKWLVGKNIIKKMFIKEKILSLITD
jgi:leucyl-tRNA synthetase